MRIVAVLRAVAVIVLSFPTLTRAQAAAEPERFTGTVKSDSGVAISTASMTVTPAGAGFSASVTVRTNTAGRWTATLPNGRRSISSRSAPSVDAGAYDSESAGPGSTTPVDVDVTLKRAPVRLGPVRITESRRQPPQRDMIGPDVAQTEKGILAASEVFAVADQGDLLGMIAQVPGITLTNDPSSGLPGFSVLGLSSAQNNVTLNGLQFGGGDVPRDISARFASARLHMMCRAAGSAARSCR